MVRKRIWMTRLGFLLAAALSFAVAILFSSCSDDKPNNVIISKPGSGNTDDGSSDGDTSTDIPMNDDAVAYESLHDDLADVGQFYIPDSRMQPEIYWYVVYTDYGGREEPNVDGAVTSGLQYHLLMQSVAGLINKACEEGRTNIAAWIECNGVGYDMEKAGIGREIGRQNAVELATKSNYGKWNGHDVNVRQLFDGYVLTDLVQNPESGNCAAVASHVYNSIIVDVRDSAYFNANGYTMTCDCSRMTLKECFDRFKDKCNNDALVVMPVKCGELREYVIKNKLFIVNLNKKWADASAGQNVAVFDEVLDWLKPNSQVLGWEQGVGEDVFVNRVSRHGHQMLAADWSYNHSLTSRRYKERQPSTLAKTINPRKIDYDKKKSFCSFFLTDGDNYQFIITDNFVDNYYNLQSAVSTKMAFEIGTQSLIQLAPTRFQYLMEKQPSASCTVMDTFGGGYYYIDTYSTTGTGAANRKANLKTIAERTAAHMRQHGIKVLHVMAQDLNSSNAKEALQAFVDANDQLEGITAVQYSPYTGGKGQIFWFKNKAGYDIPCVTAKYMIWKGITTPQSVADAMVGNEGIGDCCAVAMHAWSEFDGKKSSNVVSMCQNALPSSFELVSMQELIWRIRMKYRKEQTLKFLATIK